MANYTSENHYTLFLCGVAFISEHTALSLTPFENMRELEKQTLSKRDVGEYHFNFSEETRRFSALFIKITSVIENSFVLLVLL